MSRKIIVLVSFFVLTAAGLFGCASPQENNHNPAHVFGQAEGVFRQALQTGAEKSPLKNTTRSAQGKGTALPAERISA